MAALAPWSTDPRREERPAKPFGPVPRALLIRSYARSAISAIHCRACAAKTKPPMLADVMDCAWQARVPYGRPVPAERESPSRRSVLLAAGWRAAVPTRGLPSASGLRSRLATDEALVETRLPGRAAFQESPADRPARVPASPARPAAASPCVSGRRGRHGRADDGGRRDTGREEPPESTQGSLAGDVAGRTYSTGIMTASVGGPESARTPVG